MPKERMLSIFVLSRFFLETRRTLVLRYCGTSFVKQSVNITLCPPNELGITLKIVPTGKRWPRVLLLLPSSACIATDRLTEQQLCN